MVRSSGHHRKRSLSRSLSPSDHKRVKSSHRDREKDRNSRRRSRSRDRVRRSRSRDRKFKDKRPSESRVRSKPLKLKRRSRSRSRSREHAVKKEEKKEIKADDEPFDPTNLDKPNSVEETAGDEDWIVTDMVQENSPEEDNADENRQHNHVDENSFNNNETCNTVQNNHEENNFNDNERSESLDRRSDSGSGSESSDSHSRIYDKKTKFMLGSTNGITAERFPSEYDDLKKNKINLELDQAKEFHQLRMENEIERHKIEMKLLSLQMNYWQLKYSKASMLASEKGPEMNQVEQALAVDIGTPNMTEQAVNVIKKEVIAVEVTGQFTDPSQESSEFMR